MRDWKKRVPPAPAPAPALSFVALVTERGDLWRLGLPKEVTCPAETRYYPEGAITMELCEKGILSRIGCEW